MLDQSSALVLPVPDAPLNDSPAPAPPPDSPVPAPSLPDSPTPLPPSALNDSPHAKFRHATRIQESVTSGPEKKALRWLAARIPQSVNSDHLTVLGSAAMFLAGCSYATARWTPWGLIAAIFFLAINWFGDSLDGTLARVRNRQRPRYGFYVDHVIDSFGAVFLMAGLGASGYVDWRIAAAMLVAFLLLSIETYLATYTLGVFRLSVAKFGPTELRLLLIAANIVLFCNPTARIAGLPYRMLDFAGSIAAIIMLTMAVAVAIAHTRQLYREESI